MRILVSGADGFIGSHLTEYLLNHGVDVRAMCLYNSFNSWGWLDSSPAKDKVEIITGDVRDPRFCREAVQGVDVVMHLAALIAIPYSYRAPDSYVDTNVRGTLNMVSAAMDAGVKKFLHTSTSEVYGTARQVPIPETHPLQPQSPYSATKIAADMLALSFFNSFQFPVTVVRPFNTYGPRQSARAVIPTIISQLAAGKKEIQLGDLRPTRDFNYVEDTCRGFWDIACSNNVAGETFNVGSGTEISIGETFHLIQKLMGTTASLVEDSQRIRPENSEVMRLVCDRSRLTKLTGHTPNVNLEEGLRRTINWFTDAQNLKNYKTDIYNV